jgi:hypothetical protein
LTSPSPASYQVGIAQRRAEFACIVAAWAAEVGEVSVSEKSGSANEPGRAARQRTSHNFNSPPNVGSHLSRKSIETSERVGALKTARGS